MHCSSHHISSGYFKVNFFQTASLLIKVHSNCICADIAHEGFKLTTSLILYRVKIKCFSMPPTQICEKETSMFIFYFY